MLFRSPSGGGDLDEAADFVSLLLRLSHNVFQHYHHWGLLYRQYFDAVASVADQNKKLSEVGLSAKVPAQADMLATFDVNLLRPDVLARAEANQDTWVAPEILRASAHRLVIGANNLAAIAAERTLARSLDLYDRKAPGAGSFGAPHRLRCFIGALIGAVMPITSSKTY